MSMDFFRLFYNNKVVGYRYVGNNEESFDISLESFRKWGFNSDSITRSLTLHDYDGLLLSKQERVSGVHSEDVSGNKSKAQAIFGKGVPSPTNTTLTNPSLILLGVNGDHGEYETIRSIYTCIVVIPTDALFKELNEKLAGKGTFRRKQVSAGTYVHTGRLKLTNNQFWLLQRKLNCPVTLLKDGFQLKQVNHHASEGFTAQMIPPEFPLNEKTVQVRYFEDNEQLDNLLVGTTADGESLYMYTQALRDAFEREAYVLRTDVALRDLI